MLFDKDEPPESSIASTESIPVAFSTKMQVLLRIRPILPKSKKEKQNFSDTYSTPDSSTLITKLPVQPENKNTRSKRSKQVEITSTRKFNFTKIFRPEVDQAQFFHDGVRQRVVEFLSGQNSMLMSYGTSDSGKTYTLHGNLGNPGVIARSIEFIFSALNCTLAPWYKPVRCNEVVNLNHADRSLEVEAREKLTSCRSIDTDECKAAYAALEKSAAKSDHEICKDSMYSLWISFIEIYNESVYDLLAVDEEGRNMQLKLITDKDGVTYMQGVRMVCATTGLEAFQILVAGQSRLSVANIAVNSKSSRSHSVFTLKLLKYDKDSAPGEVEVIR